MSVGGLYVKKFNWLADVGLKVRGWMPHLLELGPTIIIEG